MRMALSAFSAVIFIMCVPASIRAATLVVETGQTFVRTTTTFTPVTDTISVTGGAQIVVSPGGRALLRYGPDCTVKIGPGQVWTVANRRPCETDRTVVDLTGTNHIKADLNALGHSPGSLKDGPGPIAEQPRPWGLYVLGGATIGTGIYVITKDSEEKKPASP